MLIKQAEKLMFFFYLGLAIHVITTQSKILHVYLSSKRRPHSDSIVCDENGVFLHIITYLSNLCNSNFLLFIYVWLLLCCAEKIKICCIVKKGRYANTRNGKNKKRSPSSKCEDSLHTAKGLFTGETLATHQGA